MALIGLWKLGLAEFWAAPVGFAALPAFIVIVGFFVDIFVYNLGWPSVVGVVIFSSAILAAGLLFGAALRRSS